MVITQGVGLCVDGVSSLVLSVRPNCLFRMMSKLYVGNLPTQATMNDIKQLLIENSITFTSVLVKRGGYAFVDCSEQTLADRAIDKLNGINFLGSPIIVEPSLAAAQKRRNGRMQIEEGLEQIPNGYKRTIMNGENMEEISGGGGSVRVVVSGLPPHLDIEAFLAQYGQVHSVEKAPSRDSHLNSFFVIFDTPDQAQHVVNELNGTEYEGNYLKAELASGGGGPSEKRGGGGRGGGAGGRGPRGFAMGPGARQTDFPLRILVQSDMVGAIIGRQGSTIRQITQQSRARVDVHRKDNVGSLEKAITIYGNPENCTNACKRILEVMKQEATTNNKGEITLKVLAHNNLIGRIIGKAGNTIKRIMQETDTKITVSSINDINSFNLERIITVKGTIDSMSKAESMISAKLRQSYENDLQAMAPQTMMFPGLHPMAMMATSAMGYGGRGGGYQGGLYSGAYPPVYQPIPPASHAPDAQETTYLYIPNNAVGAIIGTKGSHIRNMIRFSGASVKIAPLEGEKQPEAGQPTERKVTIVGSPESQWKAQYLIFEKMREEGFVSGSDDVRLTVEILVPSSQVGRIIGKGGQNVRELQRVTGSVIKLPEQGSGGQEEETTVHIIGAFFSVQSAQRRIRAMVGSGGPGGAGGPGIGGPGGAGSGPGIGGGGPRGGAPGGGPRPQAPPQ